MTLADYLGLLLDTHARVLGYLSKEMGESTLTRLLDDTLDHPSPLSAAVTDERIGWKDPESSFDTAEAFTRLENAESHSALPAHLADHLWSYPYFRRYIEGSLDLGCRAANRAAIERLIDEGVDAWQSWLAALPVSAEIRDRAASDLAPEFARFRAAVLRAGGKRALTPVESSESAAPDGQRR